MLFVQSCTPVSKIPPMWDTGVYFVAHVGYTVNIPKMYPSVHWTLGYIFEKITDLEFEVHKNIFLYEFLAIEQAGTNICWMGYQDTNFKICLSLFGCEELKLHSVHIVHCFFSTYCIHMKKHSEKHFLFWRACHGWRKLCKDHRLGTTGKCWSLGVKV